jgi:hypothetical protein
LGRWSWEDCDSKPCWANSLRDPHLQNNQSKMDWRYGSSGRALSSNSSPTKNKQKSMWLKASVCIYRCDSSSDTYPVPMSIDWCITNCPSKACHSSRLQQSQARITNQFQKATDSVQLSTWSKCESMYYCQNKTSFIVISNSLLWNYKKVEKNISNPHFKKHSCFNLYIFFYLHI